MPISYEGISTAPVESPWEDEIMDDCDGGSTDDDHYYQDQPQQGCSEVEMVEGHGNNGNDSRSSNESKSISSDGTDDTELAEIDIIIMDDPTQNNNNNNTHKSIGWVGSISISVNALAGPAVLQLPFTFQAAGVIPTSAALILVGILSALSCLHMASIVSKVPGNTQFDKVVEFSDPFETFWGRKAYVATQVLFYLCTLCMNIAAIVDTSQVVDSFLAHSVGTWGFSFDDWEIQTWSHTQPCTRMEVKQGDCYPFGSEEEYGRIILTLGYVITAAVFLPICLFDLKENTALQIFGFCILMAISTQFIVCFIQDGLQWNNVPLWGESWEGMLGVILFNFGLVMAIPAWLSEKKSHIGVGKVVYASTGISLILYFVVGLVGAAAIPNVNQNMLEPMVSGAFGLPLRLGASIFAFFIIGLDIPLFSVLTRYNFVNAGLCSNFTANILVVYMPWSISWMFYQGSAITELLSWGGILFTGAIAFLLPLFLAIKVLKEVDPAIDALRVYGRMITSKKGELYATMGLFVVAVLSFFFAILGQILTDEEEFIAIPQQETTATTTLAPDDVNNSTTSGDYAN